MTDEPTDAAILSEAQGAHRTSREILTLMQAPADDPIEVITAALAAIQATQREILTRLDIIERRLASRG